MSKIINTKSCCLFSLIDGRSNRIGNKQSFQLLDNRTKETTYVSICDPVFDSTFKILFRKNPKRLMNFLNSIHFLGINKMIISLEFQPNEFPEIDRMYNDMSQRADIVCKCEIQNLLNQNLEVSIIDVEIQIGLKANINKRLIKYGSEIFKLYDNENIQINTYVLCIIIDSDKKNNQGTTEINLIENNQINIINFTKLEFIQITKINLFNELMKIFHQSPTSSCNDRDEWLKFIGLRFWCNKNQKGLFILPGESPSHNTYINECCYELKALNNFVLHQIYEIENHDKKIIDETKIIDHFEFFKSYGKFPKLKGDYSEYQIRQILSDKYNSLNDASIINAFINQYFAQ